ncbi:hypothetical protein GCM10009785_21870 [Brooklawnia cerclae]|uniref:Uncharacterized protein n=1 Tax=Brooklawnia cerclae TaxID=349934 RepID=A0ABX0SG36_9ACTN|nr:hypothetical protein [Brooklawnia cerclae]NIH57294.1 hypothetical protein [Brooklawnia cerclae]
MRCSLRGCGRAAFNRGLCHTHWNKVRDQRYTTAQLLEDAAWLCGTDDPDRVANRLGYQTFESLRGTLNRFGATTLAQAIYWQVPLPIYTDDAGNCHAVWQERGEVAA